MKNPKSKGSQFEREVSSILSKWWTGGNRDDIFYRSASSGARATNRAAQNKTTANSAGDLCYLDSIGEAFIKYFAVEAKRGYPSFEIQRVVDREDKTKLSIFEQWIQQAAKSQADANAKSWLIIAKKNRAKALAILPQFEYERVAKDPELADCYYSSIGGVLDIGDGTQDGRDRVLCMSLTEFLSRVEPAEINRLVASLEAETPHVYRLADR